MGEPNTSWWVLGRKGVSAPLLFGRPGVRGVRRPDAQQITKDVRSAIDAAYLS